MIEPSCGFVNVNLSMISQMPTAEPAVTPELVKQHGLTLEEFDRIKKILGRQPNFTELGIFSVMWSEHCSYKNSKKELKKFPTTDRKSTRLNSSHTVISYAV